MKAFHSFLKHKKSIAITLLAGFAGIIGGLVALFGLAMVSPIPAVFIGGGLLTFACVTAGITYLGTRTDRRQWATMTVWAIGLPVIAVTAAQLLLQPQFPPRILLAPQLSYWQLPGGSRIAYRKIPAQAASQKEPVIFVHGGPGVPDMQGDSAFFGQLAQYGHDVYVYDELGTGYSSRLQDPTGYGVARDARDLEEIRAAIGAEKVILIGHSYGGGVVARYMAEHPDHVTKLILSSPGSVDTGVNDTSGQSIQARLSGDQKGNLYRYLMEPRALLTYSLLQINPRAAYAFSGDDVMDPRFDLVYQATETAMHCKGSTVPSKNLTGLGFYAAQIPQSATYAQPPSIRSALGGITTPVLIIKPSCDYLPWESAIDYKHTLGSAVVTLAYIRDAGHNSYQEKPQEYLATLRAFLEGAPMANTYTSDEKPSDFNSDIAN